jgi:hypothetical protein
VKKFGTLRQTKPGLGHAPSMCQCVRDWCAPARPRTAAAYVRYTATATSLFGMGGGGSLAARGHAQRSQAPILIAPCRNRKANEVVFGFVPFPMLLLPPAVLLLSSYPWWSLFCPFLRESFRIFLLQVPTIHATVILGVIGSLGAARPGPSDAATKWLVSWIELRARLGSCKRAPAARLSRKRGEAPFLLGQARVMQLFVPPCPTFLLRFGVCLTELGNQTSSLAGQVHLKQTTKHRHLACSQTGWREPGSQIRARLARNDNQSRPRGIRAYFKLFLFRGSLLTAQNNNYCSRVSLAPTTHGLECMKLF